MAASIAKFFRHTRIFHPSKTARLLSGTTSVLSSTPDDIDHSLPDDSYQNRPLPQYQERPNEPHAQKKARLLYQSRKRGMLENDLVLSTFAAKYLNTFDSRQLTMYDHLINKPENDWDIYKWATGTKEAPEEFRNEILDLLMKHTRNEEKESRVRQPSLFANDEPKCS
ncbi:PREDICTED: succinate dehydrogenase assembly factor 2, mitochondrial-like [Priapulus caudatus]|uniref:Succinate dehydrogenase assembly factor 2, mitochondrial n=1 Tax=Priapulus caudatus TaxID=37621 RepID=A0ABM1EG73_PRICU|nr:PREDICTED: succinate dehydrogenase assembly factor 2, mitochondrial-like [Priapulus caudatus]